MIGLVILFQILSALVNSTDYLVISGVNAALCRGAEAILYNPANLSLDKSLSIRIISPSVGVFNNSFSISQYNHYSEGIFLADKDKREIMSSIPNSGLAVSLDAKVSGIELSIGGFGLSISGFLLGKGTLPEMLFELMLWGNEIDRVYEFDNPDAATVSAISFTTSYGRLFDLGGRPFSVGLGVRYLYGIYSAYVTEANLSLLTSRYALNGNGFLKYRTAEGGTGFAFDLGFSKEISDRSSLCLSIININTGINWSSNPREGWVDFVVDSLCLFNSEDAITLTDTTLYSTDPYTTKLPIYITLAYEYRRGNLRLGMGYEQIVNKNRFSSRRPKFSLGLKYNFRSYLIPAIGLTVGGDEVFLFGIGSLFSFKKFGLRLGLQNVGVPFVGAKGFRIGVDIGYNM